MNFTPPKPGERRGGRQKGTPNKTTANVKAALEAAFQGIGGVKALRKWAEEQPTEFYKLWAKMLPLQMTGEGGGPIRVEVATGVGRSPTD